MFFLNILLLLFGRFFTRTLIQSIFERSFNLILENNLKEKPCEDVALAKYGTLALELSIPIYLYRPVV